MLPVRVSNPGPLTYESGALPIALRGPATVIGSKYLSGNNLPRIKLIRGKLFSDRYLHPIPAS